MVTRSRSYLAFLHLLSAVELAKLAKGIESQGADFPKVESKAVPHRAHVTGAILLAVAFLDGFINELYADAVSGELPPPFSREAEILKRLQTREISLNLPTLIKYQVALASTANETFDPGLEPYQPVYAVVRLRNALAHHEPRWVEHGAERPPRIDSLLQGRFGIPTYWNKSSTPLFPHKIFSFDCAKWTIQSCAEFVEDFRRRMGSGLEGWFGLNRPKIDF